MKQRTTIPLLIAVALPLAIMALYARAYDHFRFNPEIIGYVALFAPVFVGAAILTRLPWRAGPKVALLIAYVGVMLAVEISIVVVVGGS